MTGLTDTHTHMFGEEFDEDRALAMIRAGEAGVTRMFMPNIDDTTIESLKKTCASFPHCYPLMGFHPTSVDSEWEKRLAVVEKELRSGNKYYGIGEVGIDLYWDKTFKEEQTEVFSIQIEWALEFNLPLIIHCREAHTELCSIMERYKNTQLRGIFHSFGGSNEEAERLLEYKNFMLGINGVVTFKKSTLSEVLENIPLQRIVLETDSPYLAPVPHRGKRNESSYLKDIAEKLSHIYNVPLETIAGVTTDNALKVFQNAE